MKNNLLVAYIINALSAFINVLFLMCLLLFILILLGWIGL